MTINQTTKRNSKSGFTLAEVLITIGIIGIIAALTIPVLMQNIQDNGLKIAYKKSFTILSQATQRIANDNGGSILGTFSSNTSIKNLYLNYLSTIKNCDYGASTGICWATTTKYIDGTIKTDMWNSTGIVLKDGSTIMFSVDANCQTTSSGTPMGQSTCGNISIDVNGLKPPNTFGKDMYMVHILQNRILPFGTQGDSFQNKCPGTGWDSGLGCSAIYLLK